MSTIGRLQSYTNLIIISSDCERELIERGTDKLMILTFYKFSETVAEYLYSGKPFQPREFAYEADRRLREIGIDPSIMNYIND